MREKIVYTLGIVGTILLLWNFYNIFLVVPIDALQGDIFRIIFIHVPAAITADTFYAVAVVASIGFLVKKNFAWDSVAVSAVEVGTTTLADQTISFVQQLTEAVQQVKGVALKSLGVLKDLGPQIQWLHSYVTDDKVYCIYWAANEEIIKEHARLGGFPANRISAVKRMMEPASAG